MSHAVTSQERQRTEWFNMKNTEKHRMLYRMCCQDTMVQAEGMQFIHHHQCLKHQNESRCSSPQQGTFEQRGWLHPKWRYFQKSPYSAFVGFSRPESGQPGHFKNTLMNVTIRSLLCFKEETSDMGGRTYWPLPMLHFSHQLFVLPCIVLVSVGLVSGVNICSWCCKWPQVLPSLLEFCLLRL